MTTTDEHYNNRDSEDTPQGIRTVGRSICARQIAPNFGIAPNCGELTFKPDGS
jgi:hypothetical protein